MKNSPKTPGLHVFRKCHFKAIWTYLRAPQAFRGYQTNYYVHNLAMVNLNTSCPELAERAKKKTSSLVVKKYVSLDNNFLRQMSWPSRKLPFLQQPWLENSVPPRLLGFLCYRIICHQIPFPSQLLNSSHKYIPISEHSNALSTPFGVTWKSIVIEIYTSQHLSKKETIWRWHYQRPQTSESH